MSIIQIATPFNIDIEFEVAEFHKRLLAYCIDFALMILYMFSMLYLWFGGFKVGEGGLGRMCHQLVDQRPRRRHIGRCAQRDAHRRRNRATGLRIP